MTHYALFFFYYYRKLHILINVIELTRSQFVFFSSSIVFFFFEWLIYLSKYTGLANSHYTSVCLNPFKWLTTKPHINLYELTIVIHQDSQYLLFHVMKSHL